MSSADIGRRLLPFLKQYQDRGFVPRDFARRFGADYPQHEVDEMTSLHMEGLSWLQRQGLLVQSVGSPEFYRLSRDGLAMVATIRTPASMAADANGRTLLHPRISASALPIFERGADSHPEAVVSAFMQVETATRERIAAVSGTPTSDIGRDLFRRAFGHPGGALLPAGIEGGEAAGIRDLFTGAYGALRNPHAHGFTRFQSEEEVLRLLVMASQLLVMLERLPEAQAEEG